MRKGFTLVEMLVVIGIIVILTAASVSGFSKMRATAERAKLQELVSNTATAINAIYVEKGIWPLRLQNNMGGGYGQLNKDAAPSLAKKMSLNYTTYEDTDGSTSYKLIGLDRLGIIDSWAAAVLKAQGTKASEGTTVPTGGTIKDHTLYYAIDTDGDGITEATVGGDRIEVYATALVWSCGKDGTLAQYSKSSRSDDVYSWTKGQVKK